MKKILLFLGLAVMFAATAAVPTLSAAALSVAGNFDFKTTAITLSSIAIGMPIMKFVIVNYGPTCWADKFINVNGMAFETPFTQGLCEKIQTSLIKIFKEKAPSLKRTQTGYLSAVTSDVNMAGVELLPINENNGKRREVRVKFIQRGIDSDMKFNEPETCSGEDNPSPLEDIVEAITDNIRTPELEFDDDDMRLLCEGSDEYRAAIINAQLNALTVALDKKMIANQAANFGAYVPALPPGPGYKDYALLQGPNFAINPKGESDLMEDIENLESNNKPIVIGDGYLAHYMRQAAIGCCNQEGADLSKVGDMYYYRDKYVSQILGTNHFITLIPGYTQLLTWNKYKGEFVMDGMDYKKNTLIDPYTGLEFDQKWTYDKCKEKWVMFLRVWFKMYRLPSNAFKTYDDLNGVNFSLHARATAI